MPLVPTGDLVADAAAQGRGIGAFNVLHLETAEALVAAAERAGVPVILQISQNCVTYHGALEPIARASLAVAVVSSAPVAVHLDHAEDPGLAEEAIGLGLGSVMFDGSALPYEQNVALTADVAARAHAAGVAVEAELGRVAGKDGETLSAHAPGARTDPAEAAAFVAATGVDWLAVAVGSSHAMTERTAELDLDLVGALRAAAGVPLVLHGSSGVPDDALTAGIRAGLAKINVSTHLNKTFTAAVREHLDANPTVVDSRRYLAAGRDAMTAEAARLLTLFGGEPA